MKIELASPLTGWATPLAAVPDPVFAERMLGDGFAVDPIEGKLFAPGSGAVDTVHPAGHAVTLALDTGPVLLMHVGLDTVALAGRGFSPAVSEGDRVATGDLLLSFDVDQIARSAHSLVTPVVVTNGELFRLVWATKEGPIAAGAPLLAVERITGPQDDASAEGPIATRALRLPLAHGLHARPAARIARLAGTFDARTEIVADSGSAVPARSPAAMLGLALGHGATVTIRAQGPEAERAVAAVAELIESGMGELMSVADASPVLEEDGPPPAELRGIAAVPGLATGRAFRLHAQAPAPPEQGQGVEAEHAALTTACGQVRAELIAASESDGPAANIAAAHLALLDDPLLAEAAGDAIEAGKSAGFAWRQAIAEAARPLRAAADARFAERIDDFDDLERRVLGALLGEPAGQPELPDNTIVIAETLYPSQLIALAGSPIAGIATATGGATSHVAIIAAGMGVPMVAGLGPALARVADGTELILDGGTLAIAPDAATLQRAQAEGVLRSKRRAAARTRAHEPAITADGVTIEVAANCGSLSDIEAAVDEGADGCGLLRTEFLFLDRAAPPDEAEQQAAYQEIADALGECPLIVRTLDIGADKPAPWLRRESEDNPALGLRGIRLQLARRDLLETQFRALLGTNAARLRIMLPMVADREELLTAKRLLAELAGALDARLPEVGIMVETPAAALVAETLAADAAFFSIGSNDLSQYALARDRTNLAVATGLDGLHPAVLRLIDSTVRGGKTCGRWTGVCGGLAAVPEAVPVLLGLGVSELSVPTAAVAEMKALVRTLDLARCEALAVEALKAPDADAVRTLVQPLMEQAA